MNQPTALPTSAGTRLASLDQFRGYTVVGMLLVNFFGGYQVCPQVWKHTHDYCSYADTIMPQFLFAVGFALRLTIGRKLQKQGQSAALDWRILKRLFGLVLISLVVYNEGARLASWSNTIDGGYWPVLYERLKRNWCQTLMHIALTSLWVLPVIACGARVRVAWLLSSAAMHVVLSYWFNFLWCNTAPNAIDGGPLGFLTWTIPALVGSLTCDLFVDGLQSGVRWQSAVARSLGWAMVLMGAGWITSCGTRWYDVPADQVASMKEQKLAVDPLWPSSAQFAGKQAISSGWSDWLAEPPFIKPPGADDRKWNYWMMSQRAGTLSYLTFSAGFSLLVFVIFYLLCDRLGWQWSVFRTFGTNALIAYILHSLVSDAVHPFFPNDSPILHAYTGLLLFFVVNWIILRSLEKQSIYIRV